MWMRHDATGRATQGHRSPLPAAFRRLAAGCVGVAWFLALAGPAIADDEDRAWIERAEVVDALVADLTGDGVDETVLLVGERPESESPYVPEHRLVIESADGVRRLVRLGDESGGFDGSLFLGDFTGDGLPDVLVRISTGRSGGTLHGFVLSYAGGEPAMIFDGTNRSHTASFNVRLADGYRAVIEEERSASSLTVDLLQCGQDGAGDGSHYASYYDDSKRLLRPVAGFVDPFGRLRPVDLDADGKLELVGDQAVWLLFHANTVAHVRTVWRWDGQSMRLVSVSHQETGPRAADEECG